MLHAMRYTFSVVCYMLYMLYAIWYDVCYMLEMICPMLHVICDTLYVKYYMLDVVRRFAIAKHAKTEFAIKQTCKSKLCKNKHRM